MVGFRKIKICLGITVLMLACLYTLSSGLLASPAVRNASEEDSAGLITPEELQDARRSMHMPPFGDAMSVDDMIAAAIFHDPQIRAGRYELDRMVTESAIEHQWRNPQLRFGYDHSTRGTDTLRSREIDSADVALRFFPPHVWSRGAEKQSERLRIEAKTSVLQERALMVERDMREKLLRAVYLQRVLRVRKRMLQLRGRQLEHVKALQEAGEYSAVEFLQDQARFITTGNAKDSIQRDLQQVRTRVLQRMGLQDEVAWPLEDTALADIIALPSTMKKNDLLELALDQHPSIHAARANQEGATYDLRAAERSKIPFFDFFQVGYSQRDLDIGRDEESWTLQAAIEIPIDAFRSNDSRRVAELALQEENVHLDAVLEQTAAQVVEQLSAYKAALDMRERLRSRYAEMVRQTRQLMEEKEANYGAEYSGIRDLRIQLAEIYLHQYEAEYQLFRSALRLRYAVGQAL